MDRYFYMDRCKFMVVAIDPLTSSKTLARILYQDFDARRFTEGEWLLMNRGASLQLIRIGSNGRSEWCEWVKA